MPSDPSRCAGPPSPDASRPPSRQADPPGARCVVVGIGADGWAGLGPEARSHVAGADVLVGGRRHLDLVADRSHARALPWPSPLLPALPGLLAEHGGGRLVVLASGDPLTSGVGSTLVRLLGAERVRVVPAPSSPSLARARLGWSAEETEVVSLVGREVELLHPVVAPGRRLLVLSSGPSSPRQVAALLRARGYGGSELVVLARLGGPEEHQRRGTARDWEAHHRDEDVDPLHVLAVTCWADVGAVLLPRTPGLPDDVYEHDGQLTKREVRALVLSRLAPVPGQLLWDVGAGAGSVGIEWMRSSPTCRAVAVERRADRVERLRRNAGRLGVPGLDVVTGPAPQVLEGLERPDAVFVGGGATTAGVVETCWEALLPGGRLVVDAVTAETEAAVVTWRARLGGDLVRTAVQRSAPVGSFTGWRAQAAVTTWSVDKAGGLA